MRLSEIRFRRIESPCNSQLGAVSPPLSEMHGDLSCLLPTAGCTPSSPLRESAPRSSFSRSSLTKSTIECSDIGRTGVRIAAIGEFQYSDTTAMHPVQGCEVGATPFRDQKTILTRCLSLVADYVLASAWTSAAFSAPSASAAGRTSEVGVFQPSASLRYRNTGSPSRAM